MVLLKNVLSGVSIFSLMGLGSALAQTASTSQEAFGTLFQGSSVAQQIKSNSDGLTALAGGNQVSGNAINQIGAAAPLTIGTSGFSIGQVVGGISAPDPSSTFSQLGGNRIDAVSTLASPGQAGATAALVGGNQGSTNTANSLVLDLGAGAVGSLQQAVNTSASAANIMFAGNALTATSEAGRTDILGNNFAQVATNSVNSAGFRATGEVSIALDQKGSTSPIQAFSSNSAIARLRDGGIAVIDPSVSNLTQSAGVSVNSVFGQGGNNLLSLSNGVAGIGQDASLAAGSKILAGNIQSALTGTGANNAPMDGEVQVSGAKQESALSLNSIANTGGISFGGLDTAFQQNVSASGLVLDGAVGSTYGSGASAVTTSRSANLIVASTRAGNASVTGAPLDSGNTSPTQARSVAVNSVFADGAVSGALAQRNSSPLNLTPLDNTVVARTNVGAATVSSASQSQSQQLNTLSGAGAAGLNSTQDASSVGMSGSNAQSAATVIGVAQVSSALQQNGASVNAASLGAISSGGVLQSANDVGQNIANRVTTSGGAAISAGSQSVVNTTNTVR